MCVRARNRKNYSLPFFLFLAGRTNFDLPFIFGLPPTDIFTIDEIVLCFHFQ